MKMLIENWKISAERVEQYEADIMELAGMIESARMNSEDLRYVRGLYEAELGIHPVHVVEAFQNRITKINHKLKDNQERTGRYRKDIVGHEGQRDIEQAHCVLFATALTRAGFAIFDGEWESVAPATGEKEVP